MTLPVTLVLIAYNKADVISRVLSSAAAGSVVPDLVVVSDDGSDDGTPDVAESTAARLGLRCEVLRHARDGRYRIQTMRNAGVSRALDGIVLLSDSDCLLGTQALATHCEIHRRAARAIGSGPRYEFLAGTSGPFTSTFATLECAHFPFATHFVPMGANLSFRRALWAELGGFDTAYDGHYGMDEFELAARARRAGALVTADPGAYVIHCPHPTLLGGRVPATNLARFNATFGGDLLATERALVSGYVVPWYWRGRRKRPLCGDGAELDRWGAPPGFEPPSHLALSRTLAPLIGLVEAALAGGAPERATLDAMIYGIDNGWIGPGSAALAALHELQWIGDNVPGAAARAARQETWLEHARAADAELQQRRPADPEWWPAWPPAGAGSVARLDT